MPKVKLTKKTRKVAAPKKVVKKKLVKKPVASAKNKNLKAKAKVAAIPKGYHSVTPFLIVNGGAKAIEFYKKAFRAKSGLKIEQPGGKVGYAELQIGDSKIMLSDECSESNTHSPKTANSPGIVIQLYVKNVDKFIERAIAAGAKLIKPVENMYYGDRCGAIEDPYGHQWYVCTHIEDVSTREIKKRAAQAFNKQ